MSSVDWGEPAKWGFTEGTEVNRQTHNCYGPVSVGISLTKGEI